jgi:hypothetical protein
MENSFPRMAGTVQGLRMMQHFVNQMAMKRRNLSYEYRHIEHCAP